MEQQSILSENISEEITLHLKYDGFLEMHIIYLLKEKADGSVQKIGLSKDQIMKINENAALLLGVFEGYGDGSVQINKTIDLSEQVALTIKTSGSVILYDIRRYCHIEGERIPLTVGVNIHGDKIPALLNAIEKVIEEINKTGEKAVMGGISSTGNNKTKRKARN